MDRVTIKQCKYFKAVAKTGGIATAARTLGISQPAVAQAIDKMEDVTGLTLFRRQHARGMELTPQGIDFLQYADDLLASAERTDKAIDAIAEHRAGTIRLGCFQSIAPFCIAKIINSYRKLAPDITLEISEMLQGDLAKAIIGNKLDLAIMYDINLDPATITWNNLSNAQPYLIVSPDHRLADKTSVSIREIAEENYILFDAPGSRRYFFSTFAQFGIGPNIALRSTSLESVRCSVANGLGVSILSMRPSSNLTYDGGYVVPLKIKETLPPTPIVIAYRSDLEPTGLTLPFIQHCKEHFKGMDLNINPLP